MYNHLDPSTLLVIPKSLTNGEMFDGICNEHDNNGQNIGVYKWCWDSSLPTRSEISDEKAMHMEILNIKMTIELSVVCEVNGNKQIQTLGYQGGTCNIVWS